MHTQNPQHVLERARYEKILLLEPELLAAGLLVVWIEHFTQVFRADFLVHGPVIVTGIERGEVERLGGLGAPQTQRVCRVVAIAEDRRVVGYALDEPVRDLDDAQAARFVLVRFGMPT